MDKPFCLYILSKDNNTYHIFAFGNLRYKTAMILYWWAAIFRIKQLLWYSGIWFFVRSIYRIYLHIQLHDDSLKYCTHFFFSFLQIYPTNDVMGMEFICDMIISGFLYFVEIIKNDSILKIDLVGKKCCNHSFCTKIYI